MARSEISPIRREISEADIRPSSRSKLTIFMSVLSNSYMIFTNYFRKRHTQQYTFWDFRRQEAENQAMTDQISNHPAWRRSGLPINAGNFRGFNLFDFQDFPVKLSNSDMDAYSNNETTSIRRLTTDQY